MIKKIGVVTKNEWTDISRSFILKSIPSSAILRIEAQGVCGIYINGTFLEAITGRYPNRVCAFECTSLLKSGENVVSLRIGSHYYQTVGDSLFKRTGSLFNAVAAEIIIDGKQALTTDMSWQTNGSELLDVAIVNDSEYARFWAAAAIWEEQKAFAVPTEISDLTGKKYLDYIDSFNVSYAEAEHIGNNIYDFKKLYVGYLEIEYSTSDDADFEIRPDYSESLVDFELCSISDRLCLKGTFKKDENSLFFIHRRAGRYIEIRTDESVKITAVRMKLSTKPKHSFGWFECEDDVLNKIWQVGRYTLEVNRQHEYESCPRNEMKFFAGDAVIEALTDLSFGDDSLLDASFSITEIASNSGLRLDENEHNPSLWDYPAWRIISAYNHYLFTGDSDFIKKYYGELKRNLTWLINRMNGRDLIYQPPCFAPPTFFASSPLEYSSSTDRIGEKIMLNALLYKSIKCMSELALLQNDEEGQKWQELSEKVKTAINKHLWCEEKGAYIDSIDPENISQDGNALAVLFGIADEKAQRVLETVKKETHTPFGASVTSSKVLPIRDQIGTVSPLMNAFESEARFIYGFDSSALELIRACWGTMLKKGAETFWEFAPADSESKWNITSHGWASGCTYVLSAYCLGLRPISAGKYLFSPTSALDSFVGVIPTPCGLAAVKKDSGCYDLVIPASLDITTALTNVKIIRY